MPIGRRILPVSAAGGWSVNHNHAHLVDCVFWAAVSPEMELKILHPAVADPYTFDAGFTPIVGVGGDRAIEYTPFTRGSIVWSDSAALGNVSSADITFLSRSQIPYVAGTGSSQYENVFSAKFTYSGAHPGYTHGKSGYLQRIWLGGLFADNGFIEVNDQALYHEGQVGFPPVVPKWVIARNHVLDIAVHVDGPTVLLGSKALSSQSVINNVELLQTLSTASTYGSSRFYDLRVYDATLSDTEVENIIADPFAPISGVW